MKFIVTVSALFVGGKKYRRGDIIEPSNPETYGTRIAPYTVPTVVEKPKRRRRKVADEDQRDD